MISRLPTNALAVTLRVLPWCIALGSTGCAYRMESSGKFLGFITPYRMDIVQGNAVTREQVERVKPGMTRVQVRDILGSPMLMDLFHQNRWDYVFTIRRPGTEPQRRNVVALFEGNILKQLDVPEGLPSEAEFVASIVPLRLSSEPRVLELTDEQRKALPPPSKKDAPVAEPAAGPIRSYPPLESR